MHEHASLPYMEGESIVNRTHGAWPAYTAGGGQPGRDGGGTIVTATTEPTNDDWENIFGENICVNAAPKGHTPERSCGTELRG